MSATRPAGLLVAAQRITAEVAGELGEQAAVAWVHASAVACHAAQTGLFDPPSTHRCDPVSAIRWGVEQLAAAHPLLASLTDPAVNPMWQAAPTCEQATAVLRLWRQHRLVPDPRRPDGYLVGDLYQAISTQARNDRALCQTPRFVSDLLLDCTLANAVEEWGLEGLRLLDPACGTGHMLVEAFLHTWSSRRHQRASAANQALVALDTVHGVDIDPYAALIARYRLLILACCILRTPLDQAPGELPVHVAAANALLDETEPLLARGRYHVVVANPPYITCKDKAQRDAIRVRWRHVCTGQYSMAVPFEPLMHELCVPGGWVGRLTANSFMKRQFGRKLVEEFFPTIDLRWVIDTSGAYIPGHGTPTVILVSRNQPPQSDRVRAVMGKRGEPRIPTDPANGLVWSAIADAVRKRESLDRFARARAAHGTSGTCSGRPTAQPPIGGAHPPRRPATAAIVGQPTLFDLLEEVA
jgi:Eco57I restriction-modification methylase